MQKGSQAHTQNKVVEALDSRRTACRPCQARPPTDSLTRGHCGFLYSLETTQNKTPQKPSRQVRTAEPRQPWPAVPRTRRCRLYDVPSHVPVRVHLGHRPGTEGNDLWAAAALHADRVSPGLQRIRVPCHCEAWLLVPFHTPGHGFLFVVWSPTLSFFR